MSFGLYRRLLSWLGISAFLWLATPSLIWAQPGSGPCATFGVPCAVGCESHHCPPAYKYTVEGAPRIHWHHGCPRPICNPCDLPHWGYYEKCWTPWPFPPNWTHCATAPPAAFVNLPNAYPMTPPVRSLQPGVTIQGPGTAPTPAYPMPNDGIQELPTPNRFQGGRPGLNQ
jgi:hypothetical protein